MSDTATAPAAPAAKRQRPLSPHLQIYKPQITSVMSILHRITGIGLALGAMVFALWLAAAAAGPQAYATMQGFMGSFIGIVLMMGWSWALFFHLTNGVRHLLWDMGVGYELPAVYNSATVSIGITTACTLLAWIFGFFMGM